MLLRRVLGGRAAARRGGASYSSEILDEVMASFRDKGYVLERNEDEIFISWDQATF